MEIRQLISYIAVVESGSFTSAAENLQISQPTVTTHIKMLEDELDCTLLERTTRALCPTPKGEDVYRTAKEIIRIKNELAERLNQSQHIIKVGSSTVPTLYILPKLISHMKETNPSIVFDIRQGDTEQTIQNVRNGICDVGLIGMSINDPDMECINICTDKLVLVCPDTEEYRDLSEGKEIVKHLMGKPFILREDGSASQKTADNILQSIGLSAESMNILAKVNNQETIKKMVTSGMGMSILSERIAKEMISDGKIRVIDLDTKKASRCICAIRKKGLIKSKDIQTFFKTALKID